MVIGTSADLPQYVGWLVVAGGEVVVQPVLNGCVQQWSVILGGLHQEPWWAAADPEIQLECMADRFERQLQTFEKCIMGVGIPKQTMLPVHPKAPSLRPVMAVCSSAFR